MNRSDHQDYGEELFAEACASSGIRCRKMRIATVPGYRRPDFKVNLAGCGAMIEVKQLEINDNDRYRNKELAEGRLVATRSMPGARLRAAIRESGHQLRRASRLGTATAVAIFDTTGSISYTDPYNIKTAMFGLDRIIIALPKNTQNAPYSVVMKRAGKAVLTERHNTSISAVIVIRLLPVTSPLMIVYHNHFARVPFDPEHLRGHVSTQFQLGFAQNAATTWIEV